MLLYFSFGMNLDPGLMPAGSRLVGPALIRGWQLDFRYYADVQKVDDGEATVPGLVWEITAEGLEDLDRREGYYPDSPYGNLYDRVEVGYELIQPDYPDLVGGGTALIYTMPTARDLELPSDGYLGIIQRANVKHSLPEAPMQEALHRAFLTYRDFEEDGANGFEEDGANSFEEDGGAGWIEDGEGWVEG